MDELASARRPPKLIFTFAAWFSLLVPLLAAGWVYYLSHAPPRWAPRPPNDRLTNPQLVVMALGLAVSFVAGCVSLWGVKANGVLVILPPALLGILASAALEVLALFFLALSGLPQS
jgi:hypothetical protein